MHKIDTFSANSLKLLEKSTEEFILKYQKNLFLYDSPASVKAGQALHAFISYYLNGENTAKIEASLNETDKNFIENIKTLDEISYLKTNRENLHTEAPFFVKCGEYYLTGRFDALLKTETQDGAPQIQIFDWKTSSLPKNPEEDLQTVVYLYCASKLYKTENVTITYVSLSKKESASARFMGRKAYEDRILSLILKLG